MRTDTEIVHAAPEVVMDARGFFWRRHPDGSLSMLPTSADNEPVAYPLVCYQPSDVERSQYRTACDETCTPTRHSDGCVQRTIHVNTFDAPV